MRCPTHEQLARLPLESGTARHAQRLHAHVARCAVCRQAWQVLARTTRLLESVPPPVMPAHLWAGVACRLPAAPGRAVAFGCGWWKPVIGAGVAAALLCGIAALRMTAAAPPIPVASAAAAPYVAEHALLSARDPFADRASLGVMFAASRGDE